MKQIEIQKNDSDQRLDKFLTKTFATLPKSMLYKAIRTKHIKVNSKRAQISQRLLEGDILTLYLNDDLLQPKEKQYDFLRASKQLDILYEDNQILLLNKKVGLLCHADDKEYGDTLIDRVKRYLYEKEAYLPEEEASFTPALVNRIDRNTGGIVIAAKTAEALRVLNQKMKDRELHKYYLCIVHGKMPKKAQTLTGYLEKDEAKNKVFVSKTPKEGAKTIQTHYEVLDYYPDFSLLEIDLLTGRTHQIRAHLASTGHPLLGDGKYGTNAINKGTGYKKQALYSYKLTFDFKTDAGQLAYLNHKEFTVKDIWFVEAFRERSISK